MITQCETSRGRRQITYGGDNGKGDVNGGETHWRRDKEQMEGRTMAFDDARKESAEVKKKKTNSSREEEKEGDIHIF